MLHTEGRHRSYVPVSIEANQNDLDSYRVFRRRYGVEMKFQ